MTTEIHKVVGNDGHANLGDGASTVEVGTAIHDKVVIASASNSNLTGTITLERFATGDCTGMRQPRRGSRWTARAGRHPASTAERMRPPRR